MKHPLLFLLGALCVVLPVRAEIVINEIMYDTPGNPDVDYVEIYNNGAVAQNLSGWYLLDDGDLHDKCFLEGTLAPGGYLVIAGDLTLFAAKYPGVSNVNPNPFQSAIVDKGFFLGDGGDQARLFGPGSILMDLVTYNDTSPWPTEPDGDGPSLELYHPTLDNELPTSWAASSGVPAQGTPGVQNSVFTTDQPPIISGVARSIALPGNSDTVAVTATVTDAQGLGTVELFVDVGPGFSSQPMFDDGLHGDIAAGDSIFGALIATQPDETLVRYYVRATDAIAQSRSVPTGAPTGYFAYTVGHLPPSLRINEIVAVNMNGPTDEMGITEDWLELHNPGPEPVSLEGMFLSNNRLQSAEWQLPAVVLDPGAFLLVWCDDDDLEGPLHTDFKLSKAGAEIALFDTVDHGNVLIHGFEFGLQSADVSFGYLPDDADAPEYIATPTPAASNDGSTLFSSVCINEFQTTSAAGGIDDWVEFYNRGPVLVDMSGWYLSDEADEPFKYQFPLGVFIGSGGFLSINETIFGFGFSSTGSEAIVLTAADGTTGLDFYDYGPQLPDVSEGRFPDGSASWHSFVTTTQGFGNHCFSVPPLSEVSGLRFSSSAILIWDALPTAEAYDTVQGDLSTLRSSGDFSAAITGCLENNGANSISWDPSVPATGAGTFYLVRAVDFACGFGTYDTGGIGQLTGRDAAIEASASVCP